MTPTTSATAQLAQLLRRGGYLLGHIAEVVGHVRAAAGPAPLDASLRGWRQGLARAGAGDADRRGPARGLPTVPRRRPA